MEEYDIWVEFNDIGADGTTVTYVDMAERGTNPTIGTKLTAGDDKGNRCPAVVVDRDGDRLTLHLDLERFEVAP